MSLRAEHEIKHGRKLASDHTELIWGWGTPAGRRRAERRANLIALASKLEAGAQALEIGCGTGLFTEMFARTGAQLIAVDVSPDLLEKAKARNLPERQVQFINKRFEDCDMEGPFDAVIGSSVLHHLDLESSIIKIFNLLKLGGIMSFAEPNMLNPQVFAERKFRNWFPHVSQDETAFVRWKLRAILQKTGFEEIEITPFDWLHPSTPVRIINIIEHLGRRLEKTAVLREFAGSLLIHARRPWSCQDSFVTSEPS